MPRPSRDAPELGKQAVQQVFEQAPEYASQRAAIASLAANSGCSAERLRHRGA